MRPATFKAFAALGEWVRQKDLESRALTDKPLATELRLPDDLSDEELLKIAMRDVFPLGWSDGPLSPSQPVEIQNPHQSEDEGLRLLIEFVAGKGDIDLVATREYIEGSPHPMGHLLLENLRMGHFAIQAHLDLHGMTIQEAKAGLERFIHRSLQLGHGCIRIIHGRGQHSCNGHPVLKEHVQKWLSSRRMSRHIVAYTSARFCDGGGGALYVLLGRRSNSS
jgi:DNA-nicking Smr family endonuclease